MISEVFLTALLLNLSDPVAVAVESYARVETYSVTLESRSETGGEKIRYYFKKPGYVRMEFIEPHKGAILVYDPVAKEVQLRPFGFLRSLVMRLSPRNWLVRSSGGHTVDESDLGALFKRVVELQKGGRTAVLNEEEVGGRMTTVVSVEGADNAAVGGVHRYLLWLDVKSNLPLKVISYDLSGRKIEEVTMADLEVDVRFPEDFFSLKGF
jgi:outer membrane lipoprotein-sorting protein